MNLSKKINHKIFLLFLLLGAVLLIFVLNSSPKLSQPINIGYFHGGRNALFYRTYSYGYFEQEGVKVSLLTRGLREASYQVVPKGNKLKYSTEYGRVSGEELIEEILKGNFVGATVGESSFIAAASKNFPVIAVVRLGGDTKDTTARAIILRTDVIINKPEDLRGKILGVRRAGPGDKAFLLEFIRSMGLNPQKDVRIIENIPDDQLIQFIEDGTIDGTFAHVMYLKPLVDSGKAYVYRKMDWVNPEVSHSLLVFHKDFIENHSEEVKKIVRAYMKRATFEKKLTPEEKKEIEENLPQIIDFEGLDLPKFESPLVSVHLLEEMQSLLLRYNLTDKKANLEQFINNSFIDQMPTLLKLLNVKIPDYVQGMVLTEIIQ